MDHSAQASRGNELYEQGLTAFRGREQERSRKLNQESLAIFRGIGDPVGTARALIGLARVAIRERDFPAVRRFAEEAASHLAGREQEQTRAAALHMLAAVHRMSGEDAEASRLYEQTTEIYRSTGHDAGVASELMNHGYARLHLGEIEVARAMFLESFDKTTALGNCVSLAFVVAACAAFAASSHREPQAGLLYGAALAELERAGIVLDPDDEAEYERYSKNARSCVGVTPYAAAEAAGRNLSFAEACSQARALLSEDVPGLSDEERR